MLLPTLVMFMETASSSASFCFFHQLLLTNQLEMEKMKVEQEKKKCYLAQEALKEKVLENFRDYQHKIL